jgi:NitT/TauT family transport system ATP-binding protein
MSTATLNPPAAAAPAQAPVRIRFDRVSVDFPTQHGPMRVLDDVSFDIVIFQEYGVFPWLTVRQNIEFGLKLGASKASAAQREETVARYMKLMGLSDFANHFPKHLSGGMRQRLAIARAYAVKPEFLLMDEPFGALDAQTRSAMQDLLLEVLRTEGKTVMLITHSVEEAIYLSSRIVVVTARPARIRTIIDVPFGYPRAENVHEDPRFGELRAHIRDLVMQEYAAQARQSVRMSD